MNDQRQMSNYLYDHPEHYDRVFPAESQDNTEMCISMVERYMHDSPSRVLDVGCGTGRDLSYISQRYHKCCGVDVSEQMIEYARSRHPRIPFSVGDIRSFRLEHKFDLVTCLGSVLSYALTNVDLHAALTTLAHHTRAGGLLILGLKNGASLLGRSDAIERSVFDVKHPYFVAVAINDYELDRREQLLIRTRTWKIWGKQQIIDFCKFRLLFPAELEALLEAHGFRVCGMFDNRQLRDSDLSGSQLYVASIKG